MAASGATTHPAEPRRRLATFAALAAPNYRYYWLGLVLYVLGYRAEYVTYAWLIWELTHDPLFLGYLGLAQGLPLVMLQLFGGVLADRFDRVRMLLVTQTFTAITLILAFVLTALGQARVELLLALSALSSVFRAFDEPSRMALVPQLIDRERLPNAIALGSIPWQGGRIVGPSVTGILIAAFGGAFGFGLAALSSCAALGLYSRVRVRWTGPSERGQSFLSQLMEGLRFVGRNFLFASLITLALLNSVFGTAYVALLPIYADEYFAVGSSGYGALHAAHGVGAVAGTLAIATIGHRLSRRGRALLVAGTIFGLFLMLFSQSPTLPVALIALTLAGLSATFYLTLTNTILQQEVPDQLRGRVMSLYGLCWNLIPLGGLLAGALAAAVDARFAILFGGAMVVTTTILLGLSSRLRALR